MNTDKFNIPKLNIGGSNLPLNDPKLPSGWKDLPTIPDIPDFTIPVPNDEPEMIILPCDPDIPSIDDRRPDLPDEPVDTQYPDIKEIIPLPRDPKPTRGDGDGGEGVGSADD